MNDTQLRDALRASLKDRERLARALRAADALRSEPIAIVSMGCRYPGGITGPDELWEVVRDRRDVTGELPPERGWNFDDVEGADRIPQRGGFLQDADAFDAGFFNISPREAQATDPQQRLLLEVAWETLERACIRPEDLAMSPTGVFVGAAYQGYGQDWYQAPSELQGPLVAGMSTSIMSGRIAYTLGLRGPAMTIDTACSSSLTAIHLAIASLRSGECELALAGGAAIMTAPISLIGFARQNGVAPDGRCKAFGAGADGMGLGEGVGLVLLEPLSRARENGHPVLAIIRGSAANQDGASNGLAAPNGPSQRDVMRAALAASDLRPDQVDAVETHGTGTRLGDPIEGNALVETYGSGRSPGRPLWIGSLKSNIGHAQAASGVAGLIKAVEALRHGELPASLHCDPPSPLIDWEGGAVRPLTQSRAFTYEGEPRRIGVSSFGLSGTNVHMIVEESPEVLEPEGTTAGAALGVVLWPLTARSPRALAQQAARLAAWLIEHPETDLRDVAWTLATARSHHEHRAVVRGATREDLIAGLEKLAKGNVTPDVSRGRTGTVRPVTAFLFPGQGSQFAGMTRRLTAESPVFAGALRECGRALAPHVDWDLMEVLASPQETWQDQVDIVQPVLWASMVALARLWKHFGIEPGAVVGHSQGEIAAATVAGHLGLDDAASVVARRSRALVDVAGDGGMLAVRAGQEEALRVAAENDAEVFLAVVNAPDSVVVSGAGVDLDIFRAACHERGIDARAVNVDYASHSPLMDVLADRLARELAHVTPLDGQVPLYSTVRGAVLTGKDLDGPYWFENLRSTVRLDTAAAALLADGFSHVVECSVHPVLVGALDHLAAEQGVAVQGTLRRDRDGVAGMALALAEAFVVGAELDWSAVLGGGHLLPDLPTYAFDRESYWLPSRCGPHRETSPEDHLASLGYRVTWRSIPTPMGAAGAGWAVLVPEGQFDAAWVEHVRGALEGTVMEVPGDASVADLAQILHGVGRVASFLALDTTPILESGRTRGLSLTLALLQATGTTGVPVWHLTSEGVPDAKGTCDPAQAAVWGLVRIGLVERPGSGGLIDLGGVPDRVGATAVGAVLGGAVPGEDQFTLREGRLRVRRLERITLRAGAPLSLAGAALVVGGTSGLGAELARRLAQRGIPKIVLASRRGSAAPGVERLILDLQAHGAHVEVQGCDITDADAVERLVSQIPDLRAVFSTAGVLDDGLIANLSDARLDTVMAAKVAGTKHLDRATRGLDLESFVVFSSLAGTLGGPGQGNYAAANAAVDALVCRRRAEGLPGTSIAWGAVAGGNLADAATLERLADNGVGALGPEEAMDAVEALVGGVSPVTVVARMDWDAVAAAGPTPPAVNGLVPARATAAQDWEAAGLLELVRHHVADVLGYPDPFELDADRALRDLGFDSVTIVDLRRRLTEATGLPLAVATLFDHPTVHALAKHLAAELGVGAAPVLSPVDRGALAEHEPLAVVGMACRLPGGIDSPEGLWQLLKEGGEVVGPLPTDRGWDLGRYHPDTSVPGTFNARGGSFLTAPGDFDAEFFGVSPREAITMDPQQRQLLEVAWEAIESAGIVPADLHGSDTGVFLGASYNDYGSRVADPPAEYEGYLALGSASSVASGRISYTFGLQGPALTIDTACSSSLAALTVACQSLRAGTCAAALVGGVTIMSTMTTFIEFARQGAGSEDGRCRAFSADAAGAGWAEGVGMLLIEPLSTAIAAGHPVIGTIIGAAMNQDGASNGLTAPSGTAQAAVIRRALADAGVQPAAVQAIEAHGTGTELGDPIEASALTSVYGPQRTSPLWLGSLKSNIGHTQAASGVLSVMKMLLALRHEWLPQTLHAEEPSPHIAWESTPLRLVQEAAPWPASERRLAGVSSFGISGTNVHVIVGDPPAGSLAVGEETAASRDDGPLPILAAGRTPGALAARLAQLATMEDGIDLSGMARALARHAVGEERTVVIAHDPSEVRRLATMALEGRAGAGIVAEGRRSGGTAWLFSGQGSQRPGMATGLLNLQVFREAFDEVVAALRPHLSFDLVAAMGESGDVVPTERAQPALFAHQVAAARTLEALGVRPRALTGHSIGEFAALHIAGVLSLEDAARLVAARGRLMAALPSGGTMVAVRATQERVAAELPAHPGVAIAAVNGPTSVVVSGAAERVQQLVARLEADGVRTRPLEVSHAFHSPLMEPMLEAFASEATRATYHPAERPFVSTVTGGPLTRIDAQYLVDQVSATVRFGDAVRALAEEGIARFLEVGPSAVLSSQIALSTPADAVVVPLQRGEAGEQPSDLLRALATLETSGVRIDWSGWFGLERRAHVVPPRYPFDHRRYWLAGRREDVRGAGVLSVAGRLWGARVDLPDGGIVLTGDLSQADLPWLFAHHVSGRAILPATAFLELALEAADELGCSGVPELVIGAALPVEEDHVVLRMVLTPQRQGSCEFRIFAQEQDAWVEHATGLLGDVERITVPPVEPQKRIGDASIYQALADDGFDHAPAFRGLVRAERTRGGGVLGTAALPAQAGADTDYIVHPALLDAALHALAFVELAAFPGAFVPFSWRNVRCDGVRGTLAAEIDVTGRDRVSVVLRDAEGTVVGAVGELVLRDAGAVTAPQPPLLEPGWAMVEPGPAPAVLTLEMGPEIVGRLRDLPPVSDGTTVVVRLDACPVTGAADAAAWGAAEALALIQTWLARPEVATLALVTCDADRKPAHAAAWGLMGSAINEHPDRFRLIDVEGGSDSDLPQALAVAAEPKMRIGGGEAPRALRIGARTPEGGEAAMPIGTWVISGAGGTVARTLSEHLVHRGVAPRLLLVSRRGGADPSLSAHADALRARGATVDVFACDVTDSDALARCLATVEGLAGIVHAAGTLDDGVVSELTPERIIAGMKVKVMGGENLIAMGRRHGAAQVVLISSVAGVLGGAGQGGYAAANAALDALARSADTPDMRVQAQQWGLWAEDSGMTSTITEAGSRRVASSGIVPLDRGTATALFDAALASGLVVVAPARVDRATLLAARDAGMLLPAFRALVPVAVDVASSEPTLVRDVRSCEVEERRSVIVRAVRRAAAEVLGHEDPARLPVDKGLLDVGFDSLTAVELRNRIGTISGLRLPATLLFDHPTVAEIGAHLDELLPVTESAVMPAATGQLPDPESLREFTAWLRGQGSGLDPELGASLRELAGALQDCLAGEESDEELFEWIDEELGAVR